MASSSHNKKHLDTMSMFNRLKAVNIDPLHAEEIVRIVEEAVDCRDQDNATKTDIKNLELKIEQVKSDLELKIEQVKSDLELKIEQVRTQVANSHINLIKWFVGTGFTLGMLMIVTAGVIISVVVKMH